MDPLLQVNGLSGPRPIGELGRPAAPDKSEGPSFGDMLAQALNEVDAAQKTAEHEARNLMTGEGTDMHTAILAVQKADVSFQMMMAVRSKLIDAYREVMRMQM
jgi:flagellar hook-basal body complex protein FliE